MASRARDALPDAVPVLSLVQNVIRVRLHFPLCAVCLAAPSFDLLSLLPCATSLHPVALKAKPLLLLLGDLSLLSTHASESSFLVFGGSGFFA